MLSRTPHFQCGKLIILLLVNTLGLLEIAYIFWLNRWDIDKGRLLKFLEKKFVRSKKS